METAILSCRCIDTPPPSSVEALQFSPDGRWLAAGRSSGIVEVFSSASRHLKVRLSAASCSSVRNILWLPLTAEAAAFWAASEAGGAAADSAARSRFAEVSLFEWRLVTAGLHGVITAWNLRTTRVQAESPSNGGAVFSLCLCPPEVGLPAFAAACDDGRVRLLLLQGAAEKACSTNGGDLYSQNLQGEETSTQIQITHTLPKTKCRLLSVCWYSSDLVFAGNSNSSILRFSRSGQQSPFVADGQMALDCRPQGGDKPESSSTLVWRLQALRRRALLLSADSRGRITVWALPAGVALQTLHVHVADVLDIQLVECTDSWLAGSRGQDAPPLPTNEEVVLSVGVDGKLSAISRTEQDRWAVRACRYPHLCDSQALAFLPKVPGGPPGGPQGGPPGSLVVTGAADGSIKCMRNITELAGLKAPCLPFCVSPSLRGLQRPKVIWKKRLLVCPSATEVGIWHIQDSAVCSGNLQEQDPRQPPLVKLAKVTLHNETKVNCCDLAKDGQLLAVGSNEGLHLFGFHLKELEIRDLECLGNCHIVEMVTALQFVARGVLACCFFSKKNRKTSNYRRLRCAAGAPAGAPRGAPEEDSASVPSREEKKQKGRGKAEDSGAKKWIHKEIASLREAEALRDCEGEMEGTFCLSFLKVATGQELASVRDLPFPIVHMMLSPDGRRLGCLNSNSSILLFDVGTLDLIYFLPNIFRWGEHVASFCFSPDSSQLFVLGTRNGYFTIEIDQEGASQQESGEGNNKASKESENSDKSNAKMHRRRRDVRSIPARQFSREDGCIVDCKWVEGEGNSSSVLCLTPSTLYKLCLWDAADFAEAKSAQQLQKKKRKEIRLLNLSSDSEGDKDPQEKPVRPPHRQLKKSRPVGAISISSAPAYAASFCVPRVLPESMFSSGRGNTEAAAAAAAGASALWGPEGPPCVSPGGTDSTRSSATTPADSPVSHERGLNGDTTAAAAAAAAGSSSKTRGASCCVQAARALRRSEGRSFVGFAFEKCDAGTQLGSENAGPSGPVDHALVLLELVHPGGQGEPSLPPFNRKRYGT